MDLFSGSVILWLVNFVDVKSVQKGAVEYEAYELRYQIFDYAECEDCFKGNAKYIYIVSVSDTM